MWPTRYSTWSMAVVPVGRHPNAKLGVHTVSVTVTGVDGLATTTSQQVTVYRAYCGRRC